MIFRVILLGLALCIVVILDVSAQLKPEVSMNFLVHTHIAAEQKGFGAATLLDDGDEWLYGASVSRMRLVFGSKLTDRDFLAISTEISGSVGMGASKVAEVKLLDARYDHKFGEWLTVSAGKMLVTYNRNGYQSPACLLGNNYGFFQLLNIGILQSDVVRDVGVNFTGEIIEDKLKYRAGAFMGRRTFEGTDSAPLRFVGRLQYDFLDEDRYFGSNCGVGRTFTLAIGAETQGTYYAANLDGFLDLPLGEVGSITANTAFTYMTGGDDPMTKYSFANILDEQFVYFAELGYYFKRTKLQPWVKFERLDRVDKSLANDTVFGGGLNYYFNGYGSNLGLSYVGRENSLVGKIYSQVWLQLQVYIF